MIGVAWQHNVLRNLNLMACWSSYLRVGGLTDMRVLIQAVVLVPLSIIASTSKYITNQT
jgi:hypothetical protein